MITAGVLLAACTAPALAGGYDRPGTTAPASITASPHQQQQQRQAQLQQQRQQQTQRASARNSTVVSVDNQVGAPAPGPQPAWPRPRSNTPDLSTAIAGGGTCAVGATGGLSLPGFGIIGGGNWEGRNCELRQYAALLSNMHRPDAALAVLCQNVDVRWAMIHAGTPCQQDRPPPAEILYYRPGVIPAWCHEKPLSFTEQYPSICFPSTVNRPR